MIKKGFVVAVVLGFGLGGSSPALADGCYLCQEGGYVKFEGNDTFGKRKEAKEQFGCTVSGTTSTCSHSRGTVAWIQKILRRTC